MVNNYSVHGTKRDYTECQSLNSGFFSEALQQGTISWITAGQDHNSDFWGSYGGINLSLGRKSGFGGFGPKFNKRGVRMLDLKFDMDSGKMNVETWIREEDANKDLQEEWSLP